MANATQRFFSMVRSVAVKDLLLDGKKACALTRYDLQSPKGNAFHSDVAEILTVENGRIALIPRVWYAGRKEICAPTRRNTVASSCGPEPSADGRPPVDRRRQPPSTYLLAQTINPKRRSATKRRRNRVR